MTFTPLFESEILFDSLNQALLQVFVRTVHGKIGFLVAKTNDQMPASASFGFECASLLGEPSFEFPAVHGVNLTEVLNNVNEYFNRSVKLLSVCYYRSQE